MGYEAEAANKIAELTVMYLDELTTAPKDLGRGDGIGDAGLHLWADEEFFTIQTCLTHSSADSDMRVGLLDFLERFPDQAQVETAVIVLGRALSHTFCNDANGGRPHMEACVVWASERGAFVGRNICESAVVIRFMAENQPDAIEGAVGSGEIFRTGLVDADVRLGWWMFTACPEGHTPSVPFVANSRAIEASAYACVPK